MKNLHLEQKGNCVAVYKLGSTTVRVCDDCYKNRSPNEVAQTIENIKNIYIRSQQQKMLQGNRL